MLHVNFNAYNNYVTDSLYQWDINQDLIVTGLNLTEAPDVHFSNAITGGAIVKHTTLSDGVIMVRIPNSLLREALTIKAHIGIYENETFKTIEKIEIPIISRARPLDYVIEDSDEEVYSFKKLDETIDDIIEKINNGIEPDIAELKTLVLNIDDDIAEIETEITDLKNTPSVNNASSINYDNTESGLTATTAQGAIDEINNALASGRVKFQVVDGKLQYSVYTEEA